MLRIALTAFRKTPKLAQADPKTVFAAVLSAAQFGWEIGWHAYLIPYLDRKRGIIECQLVPAWRGLADLSMRTGKASLWTGAVFDGDQFKWSLGDKPFLRHKPSGEDDVNKLTNFYAVGRTKWSDWPVLEVWTREKVIKHRDRYNKIGKDHYSYEHFEMYGRKVVLLQVIKYMPQSVELQAAVALEYAAEAGEHQTFPAIEADIPIEAEWLPDKPQTMTEAVKNKLKEQAAPPISEEKTAEIWPNPKEKEKETANDRT